MPKPRQTYSYVDDWKSLWKPDLEAIAYNGATCDPTRVDSKVLEWAKQNCSRTPHFIKIINKNAATSRVGLSNARGCQLSVPKPFVKEHFRELQRVVTLENDEGQTWRVSFGAARTDPSWLQGWKRVADDNDLKPGEVVVFVLVANSRFHFTHFDEDGKLISHKSTNSKPAAVREEFTITANPEVSYDGRTSWKFKRAVALASRINQCAQPSGLGFDGHGHTAPRSADVSSKRRRLCKVEEVQSKTNSNNELNLVVRSEHPLYDSEEAGSTSMATQL